jgi:hypothetical protein
MHNTLVCLPFGTLLAGFSRVVPSSSSAPSRSAACRVLPVVLWLPVSPPGPSSAAAVAAVRLALQLLVFSVLYQLLFFFAVGAYLLLPVPYAKSGSCRAVVSVRVVEIIAVFEAVWTVLVEESCRVWEPVLIVDVAALLLNSIDP